jgi:hypothetical protein
MSNKKEQAQKNDALRQQLAQQVEMPAQKKAIPSTEPGSPAGHPEPEPRNGKGRPVAFWINDEIRGILDEVGIMLYAKGIKPSDSLVVRVALRLLPRDHRLIEGAREMIEQDRRRQRNRSQGVKVAG